jgi:hypothetical protein
VHSPTLTLYDRPPERLDAVLPYLAPSRADPDADRLERVHDVRLVRPPQVQIDAAADRDRRAWGIAFIEYCLAVPANRIGSAVYSTAELKTMQEVITLVVFIAFSTLFLREQLSWNHLLGFALIAAGAGVVFLGKG